MRLSGLMASGMVAASIVLGACRSPVDVDHEPGSAEVGFIQYNDKVGTLDVQERPDGVWVKLVTIGGGCASAVTTRTEIVADMATITPFDDAGELPDVPCPLINRQLQHTVGLPSNMALVVVNTRRYPTLEPVRIRHSVGVVPELAGSGSR